MATPVHHIACIITSPLKKGKERDKSFQMMEPPKKATMEYQDRSYPERNVFTVSFFEHINVTLISPTIKT